MSFTIKLYKTTSPNNAVDKNITDEIPLTGELRDNCSMIRPVVELEPGSNPSGYNYLYIEDFGRYYFIIDIQTTANGLFRLSCSEDPLMSFKAEIRNCSGIVKRSASPNAYNVMIDDGAFKAYADPYIITTLFPAGFTTREYVLAVAGSAQSSNT